MYDMPEFPFHLLELPDVPVTSDGYAVDYAAVAKTRLLGSSFMLLAPSMSRARPGCSDSLRLF